MLPQPQHEAFEAFYDSARHNDILDPKTTLLLHLGAALAAGCDP